jgi:anaerobic selenocysteine-containing dehydrogenase
MDASSTFLPNRSHPYSEGAFCIKGIRGAPGITYSENRLLHPMRRTGERGEGKWARISWDEALDETADHLAAVRQTGGDRRRDQRRLLRPQHHPGADAALDRVAQLDDQPGSVRRLPRGERARHGPRHRARRGHR